MKLLVISIHGHELVRTRIQGSQIIIGRSPVCDVILRAPKINPVHFMLEKLELEKGVEEWSVFNISPTDKGHEKKIASSAFGSGLILGNHPLKIGDIEFKWVNDSLTETQLHGGALKDHLEMIQKNPTVVSPETSVVSNMYLMELITVNSETESVSQVNHFKLRSKSARFSPLAIDPRIKISWHLEGGQDIAKLETPPDVSAKKIISKNTFDESKMKGMPFSRGEMVLLNKQDQDFYLRFVPQIEVPKIAYQIWADPFYRNWAITIVIFLLFMFWIKSQPLYVEPVNPAQLRIAQIKRPAPPPQPPEMEIKKPESVPEPEVKKPPEEKLPEPSKIEKPIAEKPPENLAPKKKAAQPEKSGRTKLGKEDGSPKKITEVGLFAGGGLFKSKSPSVKADNLKLSGSTTPLASNTGSVIVNKAPGVDLGLVGEVAGEGPGVEKDLKGLKSDIKFKDKAEVGKGRVGGTFSDGDFSLGLGGSESNDFPGELGDREEVKGGLDKESIRRTLANYKRDIRTCYEKALATQSKVAGRIVYKWGISPSGKTSYIEMTKTSVIIPTLEVCVKSVIKDIQWPIAANGQSTVVIYPFQFQSKK